MDDRTEVDEARRRRQRDARSAVIDREVDAEISARAERRDMAAAADAAAAERLAAQAEKRDQLELDERKAAAATSEAEALEASRVRGRARERNRQVSGISRVITYLFSLVYGLLLIRIALVLLAASPATPFVRFIDAVARPFHAPFEGIASSLTTNPEARVVVPMVVAILVAVLVHAAIMGLLRLFARREVRQD